MANANRGEVQTVRLHGHERAFVKVGKVPPAAHPLNRFTPRDVVACHRRTRRSTLLLPRICSDTDGRRNHRRTTASVDTPSGMRDLLTVLGIERDGCWSQFGWGVAAQFAYQFPQRTRADRSCGRWARSRGQPDHPVMYRFPARALARCPRLTAPKTWRSTTARASQDGFAHDGGSGGTCDRL